MEVIIDNRHSVSRLKEMLISYNRIVPLEDIDFVGVLETEATVSTLPSTFPDGQLRCEAYFAVKKEKNNGLTPAEIARKYPHLPVSLIRSNYYQQGSRAGRSAEKAVEEGILPFSYRNSRITSLNSLLAFAFWTGSVSQGIVEINPNRFNQEALEKILGDLDYRMKEGNLGDGKNFNIFKGAYLVYSSQLSRTFALLGLPYKLGQKAEIAGLDIPWYARFMFGDFMEEGQVFGSGLETAVDKFRKIFLYTFLSEKANDANLNGGIALQLMGSKDAATGRRIARRTAACLRWLVPELEISPGALLVYRKSKRASTGSRIYLYNCRRLLSHLETAAQYESSGEKTHLYVRDLASKSLLRILTS